jgi:hypothetical protein
MSPDIYHTKLVTPILVQSSNILFHIRAHLAPIISFHLVEMKWHAAIILFDKTQNDRVPNKNKLRHEIKIKEFQMNSVINSVTAKQVAFRITK